MRAAILAGLVVAAGCHQSDPCAGVSGICVALTVQSSSVSAVDSLRIVASGAVSGDHTSTSARTNLPVAIALKLPATTRGVAHFAVTGSLGGSVVGTGVADATVAPGQHVAATCTLVETGAHGGDLAGVVYLGGADLGGADLAGTGSGDMAGDLGAVPPKPCDPAGVTGPQCVWRWQTPLPQGDSLLGVVALSDASTFSINTSGQLMHRDASSWSLTGQLTSGTSRVTLAKTLFSDQNQDIYVGGTITTGASSVPGIMHSNDGGSTWTVESLPTPSVSIGGLGLGAAGLASAILPAQSSGTQTPVFYLRNGSNNTWSQNTTAATNGYWNAATIGSAAVLVGSPLVSPTAPAIAYSNNGGFTTWSAAGTISGVANTTSYTAVCSGTTAGQMTSYWAIGSPNIIVHSSGVTLSTWTQQGAAATGGLNLYGCVAADSTHAWAFGLNGAVVATTDGSTWGGVTSGSTQELMFGTHSPSGTALTIVGNGGAILRSTNGTSFNNEQTGYNGLVTTAFGVASKTVFAVGQNDTILRTVDDGANWTQLTVANTGAPASTYYTGVWGFAANDVYAVGSSGNGGSPAATVLVHSSDGMTFQKFTGASVPANIAFNDVYGSALGVFAVGQDVSVSPAHRAIFRSPDHGASWSAVTITGFTGVSGTINTVFATDTDVWIGGDANIFHSTNGTGFTSQTLPAAALSIVAIRGTSNGNDLWAVEQSMSGDYLRSNNGGAWTAATGTWTDIPIHVVVQPDDSAIYVLAADTFQAQVSINKGASWMSLDTRTASELSLNGGFAFAPNDLFLVGATGIIHYGN
jgi:hypothetical protein